ncbi:MAG: hypothetical protein V7727_16240 [Sneathiella sp.]
MTFRSFIFVVLTAALLVGCGTLRVENRIDTANALAKSGSLTPLRLKTSKFLLAGFQRVTKTGAPITLYIEGDGFAWVDKYTISSNPTPRNPLALKLAGADKSDNVIYLSRPCQFIDIETEPFCQNRQWTSHRFSRDIINGFHETLNWISKKYGSAGFHLVGFSGGGAVAAILTAERRDILSLRTIGGNLDHAALNAAKNVSPLTGSINPINTAVQTRNIPQIHYSGENDTVVPAWISARYVQAVGNSPCATAKIIMGASHLEGWEGIWPQLGHDIPPPC